MGGGPLAHRPFILEYSMQQFKIYKERFTPAREPNWYEVTMQPVMTITAKTAAQALKIAKQKGVSAPVVGLARAKSAA